MRRRGFLAIAGAAPFARPSFVCAQARDKVYNLAILTHFEPVDRTTGKREQYWTAFFDELRRLGYDEGRNLAVAWHSSQVGADAAADLVRRVAASKPDAIFTPDARMALLLRTAAATIPVVAITGDPVGSGVAASLARPGGNVTGFSIDAGLELVSKRLELFRQAVPKASRLGWLSPRRTIDLPITKAVRESARLAGVTLVDAVLEAPVDAATFRRVFEFMTRDGVDSLWVTATGEMLEHRRLIAELAMAAKLASMFGWRENVEAGGLMSYGNDVADTFRRSAAYVDRVLRGANPAEMPFQQPNKFEFVINLKTAKALGLTLPPLLLSRADEVIE